MLIGGFRQGNKCKRRTEKVSAPRFGCLVQLEKKGDTRVFDYVVLQPVTLAQKIWVKADMVKARLQGLQSLVGSSAASVT